MFIHGSLVKSFCLAALCAAAVFGLSSTGARAANPLELNFGLFGPRYEGQVAGCDRALPMVATQFWEKESSYWNSALRITGFADVREVAFRPWQSSNIPRRYCSAKAMLSDGKVRTVHFSVIEDGGFAGAGDGVEWCVVGLDRNWANGEACRAARP